MSGPGARKSTSAGFHRKCQGSPAQRCSKMPGRPRYHSPAEIAPTEVARRKLNPKVIRSPLGKPMAASEVMRHAAQPFQHHPQAHRPSARTSRLVIAAQEARHFPAVLQLACHSVRPGFSPHSVRSGLVVPSALFAYHHCFCSRAATAHRHRIRQPDPNRISTKYWFDRVDAVLPRSQYFPCPQDGSKVCDDGRALVLD